MAKQSGFGEAQMTPDDLSPAPEAPRTGAMPGSVARAVAHMHRSMTGAVAAAALADASGVSERTLRRHFLAFLGSGPLEHHRRMRLAAVRQALLAPHDEAATVTEIATAFGFTHLGRFASAYMRRFGEAPSATIAHGRAMAPRPFERDAA